MSDENFIVNTEESTETTQPDFICKFNCCGFKVVTNIISGIHGNFGINKFTNSRHTKYTKSLSVEMKNGFSVI